MYSYIIGIISEIAKDHIVLENNGIGYLIYVSNPYQYTKGKETKVFIYQQVKEDALLLYGFLTREEKDLFLKLLLVKGIGCKIAIGVLATNDVDAIIEAIEASNSAYLKRIPGIGPKAAQQIILDLQGKFKDRVVSSSAPSLEFDEAVEVLLALGYKQQEIDKVMSSLANESLDTNGYVKKALGLLVKM